MKKQNIYIIVAIVILIALFSGYKGVQIASNSRKDKMGIALRYPFERVHSIIQDYAVTNTRYAIGWHTGIDIPVVSGTPIYAAADGEILTAKWNNPLIKSGKLAGYGLYVFLYDPATNQSVLYAHLSQLNVRAGQRVRKGDIIAYSGNTGNSDGPHLHIGFYEGKVSFNNTLAVVRPVFA